MRVIDLDKLPIPLIPVKKEIPIQTGEQTSFAQILNQALNKVNDLQLDADDLMEKMATGEATSLHEVMISVTKAEMALQFVLELRNKLTDLYKEIMRMPL